MGILVASSNPAREFLFFFLINIFAQFSRLSGDEKGEHYFIVHFDVFIQLYSVIKHAHWTFIQTMAEKSAEKSNRKAMNRNWSNQKANPAHKTKAGNK